MSGGSKNPFEYLQFFSHAVDGLAYVFKSHNSFTIQSIIALGVILTGTLFKITRTEWLILLITIFAVLVAELLNTAVETALDYMTDEHRIDVKIAKDVAAGAVLMTSLGAVVVGSIIFGPYILEILG